MTEAQFKNRWWRGVEAVVIFATWKPLYWLFVGPSIEPLVLAGMRGVERAERASLLASALTLVYCAVAWPLLHALMRRILVKPESPEPLPPTAP
jgi:hypothetical protein